MSRDPVLVFFDTETTGLHLYERGAGRIVEFGAYRVGEGGSDVASFQTLVNPQRPIPSSATRVHGIADDDVAGAPIMAEVLPRFLDFIGSADMVWGFNTPFDARWLVHECLLESVDPPDLQFYDVARMAGYAGLGRVSLAQLVEAVGATTPPIHRALDDAVATASALGRLLDGSFGRPVNWKAVVQAHDRNVPTYDTDRALSSVAAAHQKHARLTVFGGRGRPASDSCGRAEGGEGSRRPRVCVTGTLDGVPRKDVARRLQGIGYDYCKEPDGGDVEFVVVGKRAAGRKVEIAERGHVPTLAGDEFLHWLAAREAAEPDAS